MLRATSSWLTVLLGALTATTALAIDMSLPALPTLAEVFATTADRVQLTLSLFVLAYGIGQLFYGPLSDRFGRRPLLLLGIALYALAGIACAFSPTIESLVAARFVQGLGGCAGPVLARAIVRDHHKGVRAAQMLSSMTLVFALGPMVAPFIGGFLLARLGWQAIYLSLGLFGVALTLAIWAAYAESLRMPDREAVRLSRLLGNLRGFLGHRLCVGYALVNLCVMAGLFAFISGSPFVLIEVYGVAPARFGLYFALSAVGIMLGAFTNSRLLRRHSGERVLRLGLGCFAVAGAALLLIAWSGWGGAFPLVAPMVLYCYAQGLVMPNAVAAAMEPVPHMAGLAASLLGFTQMVAASLSGYVVNLLYNATPLPMAAVIAVMAACAIAAYLWAVPRHSRPPNVTTL